MNWLRKITGDSFSYQPQQVPLEKMYCGMKESDFREILPQALPGGLSDNGYLVEKAEFFGLPGTFQYNFHEGVLTSIHFGAEGSAWWSYDEPQTLEETENNFRTFETTALDALYWMEQHLGRPDVYEDELAEMMRNRLDLQEKVGEQYLSVAWVSPENYRYTIEWSMLGKPLHEEEEQAQYGRDFLSQTYRISINLMDAGRSKLEVNKLRVGMKVNEVEELRPELYEEGISSFNSVNYFDGERHWTFDWSKGRLVAFRSEEKFNTVIASHELLRVNPDNPNWFDFERGAEIIAEQIQRLNEALKTLHELMETAFGQATKSFWKSQPLGTGDIVLDHHNDEEDLMVSLYWELGTHSKANVYAYAWGSTGGRPDRTVYIGYYGVKFRKA
jgi:hypothetical protein